MALPASKNALKKLGDRLASGAPISAEDADLLNAFILSYDEPLAEVQSWVTATGYEATSRLKTRGTLIEKLQRDPHTKLPSVQDVAGLRVTVEGLIEQDEAVDRLRSALGASDGLSKIIDRRATPTHGYRAVHIIATAQGVPVEIQIRTVLQDLWAQVSERMGDVYGRDIRYGGPPRLTGDSDLDAQVRHLVASHCGLLSTTIFEAELILGRVRSSQATKPDATNTSPTDEVELRIEQLARAVDGAKAHLLDQIDRLGRLKEEGRTS